MPSIEWNHREWDNPSNWVNDGDEWTFHAESCGQRYEDWKRSVVSTFINPYLGSHIDMLEIGSGHGRWTEFMVGRVRSLTLVDLNPTCIEVCRERFGRDHPEVRFITNDGRSLPVPDESVDVIWSFASFVHVDEREIDFYLGEFRRVLRPDGRFFVHHAGWARGTPVLAPIAAPFGRCGRVLLRRLAQGQWRGGFARSPISAQRFKKLSAQHGLTVERQLRHWGARQEYGLAARDVITLGSLAGQERAVEVRREAIQSAD